MTTSIKTETAEPRWTEDGFTAFTQDAIRSHEKAAARNRETAKAFLLDALELLDSFSGSDDGDTAADNAYTKATDRLRYLSSALTRQASANVLKEQERVKQEARVE